MVPLRLSYRLAVLGQKAVEAVGEVGAVGFGIAVRMGKGLFDEDDGALEIVDAVFAPLGELLGGEDFAGVASEKLLPDGHGLVPAA